MSRAGLAGLVVMGAAPFAAGAPAAAEPGPSVAEAVFVDRLRALVEARRWADAARHIQQVQALRPEPEWLATREGEVWLAQVRIGLAQQDLPGALKAARMFVNGDAARSLQLMAVARVEHAAGNRAVAVALVQEIVRRSPDFTAAARALAEWDPSLEKKAAPAEKKAPLTGEDEAVALLAQVRSAQAADDAPAMLAAARLFLTGDRGRAARLLEVAREYFGRGDRVAAVRLTREVVRRTPDFAAAERQLAEFQAAEKK